MSSEQLYLQVDKKTTAILGATTVPEESVNIDLVKVTEAEFTYLDLLSSTLPDGWVVSLSDLEQYRANRANSKEALASHAKTRAKIAAMASGSASKKTSKPSNTSAAPTTTDAGMLLKDAVRKFKAEKSARAAKQYRNRNK